MRLIKRIRAFINRNRGAVLRKAFQAISVRIWVRFRLWRFTSRFFRPRAPETWVFMGGCYNSGTTILREMIGAHPEVASLPREGVELTDAFPDLEAGGWVRMWFRNAAAADLSQRDPLKLAQQAMRDWSPWWRRGARVFIEKSIVHGAWMPVLDAGFPNARFIGVVRNGNCACEGIRRRARPEGVAREVLGRDDYPIDEVGRQWVFANEVLLRDCDKLESFRLIHYEDFVDAPLESIRGIFTFIGVDPAAAQRMDDGSIRIGARRFSISDQNAASIARLSDADRAMLEPVIGPMMTQLGYETIGDNRS